jgi:hypothetical protein
MRVLVCGSRSWTDEAAIQRALEGLPPGPTTILHGGARGADQLAGRIAKRLGYSVEVHEADWRIGRRAGLERNMRMLDSKPDLVLTFWDEQSRGTGHTITEARRRNIPVVVVTEGHTIKARPGNCGLWLFPLQQVRASRTTSSGACVAAASGPGVW